jgi:hypothetical protein
MRCATSGCGNAPTELAAQGAPGKGGGIAVDSTSIYFWSADRVMKLTPK